MPDGYRRWGISIVQRPFGILLADCRFHFQCVGLPVCRRAVFGLESKQFDIAILGKPDGRFIDGDELLIQGQRWAVTDADFAIGFEPRQDDPT